MRRSPQPFTAAAPAWAIAVLLAATGCTICPDPFDYTGPVPNGSAPQNDFRARSNGITPIGGVPRPWPPVVQAAPASDAEDSRPALAAGEEQVDTAADDEAAAEAAAVQATATEAETGEDHANPELPAIVEPTLEEILPPGPPARLPILPRLRETPGWRPRR